LEDYLSDDHVLAASKILIGKEFGICSSRKQKDYRIIFRNG